MLKRLVTAIIAAALLISLCGCGSIFDKEYSSVTDYSAPGEGASDGKNSVRNYYSLKQAVLNLVDARKESGVIVFDAYDGDISTDLKSACWELRTQDALCAYCVAGISYELNHIVSYDEATMYIKYSRSQAEIDQVAAVSYSTGIKDYLADAINKLQTKAVLLVKNCALDSDGVKELIAEIYTDDPLCAVTMPESTVYMYSGSGLQRLFDIRLSYGGTASGIAAEKTRLAAAVETAAKACADDDGPSAALKVCNYMVSRCVYSKTSDMNTVYYAMMYGTADSEGMALTYKALCSKLGIECRVVKGLMNQEDHWWNIIKLGDDYYHVDVSRCRTDGIAAGFLRTDVDMWSSYRWETAAFPECVGSLTYADVGK